MRKPRKHVLDSGETRYRVRYRLGGKETSETFVREVDAQMFAGLLGDGRDNRVTEALAWLAAKQTEQKAETFGQWFETYVNQLTGVTDRTRDSYGSIHRNHLVGLDPLPLPLIARGHVTDIVNKLDRDGLSPKTIRNIVHLLASCLALAVDEGHITKNPCRRIRLPQARIGESGPRFLSHDEFATLYAHIPDHYKPLVAFLVGTGLRWSEATALQCRHIDLEAGTVAVRQAWKQQGGRDLGPPKTEKGRRTVNAAVIALEAAQYVMRNPDDWLFTTPTGQVVRYSNFYTRIWVPACKASGIDTTIHTLRHTHASWLISDGQSLEAVQDQLGHESILTTRKIYGHLLPAIGVSVGRSASAALERALPGGLWVLSSPADRPAGLAG